MPKITLDVSDLMSDAHDEGYELKVAFATEAEIPEYIAAKYMAEAVGTDTVEEFRIRVDKAGNEIDDGALDPDADYGEFFTAGFTSDFRELAGRDPTGEDWGRFDSEIRSWVQHYADEEKKS